MPAGGGRELFWRKRWMIMKYNIVPHSAWTDKIQLMTPFRQQYYGSLSGRLQHYSAFGSDSMGDRPQWVRTFRWGKKTLNYMMWNLSDGRSAMWKYVV